MPTTHAPYPVESRREVIELVRTCRTPRQLAWGFDPATQAIRNWLFQDDRDTGPRDGQPPRTARVAIRRLRRAVRQSRLRRQIPGLVAVWFAPETDSIATAPPGSPR